MDLFNDIEIADLSSAIKLFNESRTGFLKLFNNSPICMSMTTTTLGKRTFVRVNKAFLEKFGFEESEIIGRSSIEVGILEPEESLRVGDLIKKNGRLQNDYVKCITKTGRVVHTMSSIEVMEMSEESYLVSFFVDITKVMEQQAIIEQHAQQLQAVNKELEAFSYSVSHDLRAPLRAISSYAQMLEEDFHELLNDQGKKNLSAIQRNTKKMGRLIDDLLSFAKLGKTDMRKTTIDMNELVDEVIAGLAKMNHHATISRTTLHSINGDQNLIKQVIENLLANAIKYSSKKDQPTVDIASKTENNTTTFTIQDNGSGFDMQYVDRLFGVFQRLHASTDFEGTGVGLAIVQRIINKHGGTIRAEAELQKGATFTFTLPV